MTYQQCMVSEVCRLAGVVNIEEVNHAFMGRLMLKSGECVHLSLSDKLVSDLRKSDQTYLSVYGDRLPKPIGMDDIDFLEVNGRRVGWDICSDYYLFVSKAKIITEPNWSM